jgi:hypothetical protein
VTAFPDLRIDLTHQHACGEASVLEGTLRGTHRAGLGPIPATGKTIELGLCDVIEVRDGKVYREREYLDQMTKLGMDGAPGSPEGVQECPDPGLASSPPALPPEVARALRLAARWAVARTRCQHPR